MDYYLLTADQITGALAANGCANPGGQPIDQYKTALGLVLSRVEGLMGVDTLVRGTYTDTFEIEAVSGSKRMLRLSNALLTDPLVLSMNYIDDRDGNESITGLKVDRKYGIVYTAPRAAAGTYNVTYQSGLAVDEDGFFQDVPNWLTSIAINCIISWFRMGLLSPKVPENVSYAALIQATVRELQTRVYESYQRPRFDVLWAEQLSDGL